MWGKIGASFLTTRKKHMREADKVFSKQPCDENRCQYPMNPQSTQQYCYPDKLMKPGRRMIKESVTVRWQE